MEQPSDLLPPDGSWPSGWREIFFETVGSTNDAARRLAVCGPLSATEGGRWDGEPVAFHARHQSGGRGRRGRVWESRPGNLLASLLIRGPHGLETATELSFVAALAAAQAVRESVASAALASGGVGAGDESLRTLGPPQVRIKWPNDILLAGAKVAGLLLETEQTAKGVAVVIGVGINCALAPHATPYPATALAQFMEKPPETRVVLTRLLRAFETWQAIWRRQGFAAIRQAWLEQAAGRGQEIAARLPDRDLHGVFTELSATGALILVDETGQRHEITAGDIFWAAGVLPAPR